jgi:hypothetical protein
MVHKAAVHARKHRLSHLPGLESTGESVSSCAMVGQRSTGAFPKLKLMCDGKVICARRCMERALRAREMVGPRSTKTSASKYIGAVFSQGQNPPSLHIVV